MGKVRIKSQKNKNISCEISSDRHRPITLNAMAIEYLIIKIINYFKIWLIYILFK